MNQLADATEHEELRIFVERFLHFMNLWTIYKDMLSGQHRPSYGEMMNDLGSEPIDKRQWPVDLTMMFVLYAYFYSLVEDSDEGLNGFRVWREVWPKEKTAIDAMEARVAPFRDRLRIFRNRLVFLAIKSGVSQGAT